MSIALYRLDDRLIHGQVVVGWGKPLNVGFIVLVDDAVRSSAWEQELYRMGVPTRVNVGGVHHRPGRSERLRYVYLSDAEAAQLRKLAARGVQVTAQDVPTAVPVPLEDFT